MLPSRKNPIGPEVYPWEDHTLSLSGTQITFKAPRYNRDPVPDDRVLAVSLNLYDEREFGRYNEKNSYEPPINELVLKNWQYSGLPFFDQANIGDVRFMVSVARFPEFNSLFRPRRFECAIERHMYAANESLRASGRNRLDWEVQTIGGLPFAHYRFNGYPGFNNAIDSYTSVWQFPLTEEHMLNISFKQVIRVKRTRLAEAYAQVIDKVMSTFSVELSSEAERQRRHDRERFPWETLPEHLPPYTFEEFDVMERFDLLRHVRKKLGFDGVSDDEYDKEVLEETRRQKRKARAIKESVLASHLRFEALEADDLAAYRKSKAANT